MTIEATWLANSGSSVCDLRNGTAHWQADLDAPAGDASIPNPHELLDSALAACTTLTLQVYARRRGYDLQGVRVTVSHDEAPGTYKLVRHIELQGDLAENVREDLLRVANKCPVHKSLSAQISIDTTLGG